MLLVRGDKVDKKKQLIEQIRVVIGYLEEDYGEQINNSGVLHLIYKRYKKSLDILTGQEYIVEIHILGGVKAYMDSYSDYQNRLLAEMNNAEKIMKEIRLEECKK